MEELLKQFMEQINTRFDEFANEMRKELGEIKEEQNEMRKELGEIKVEQNEMRKEIAFFYGSLMREIDNSRVEARSQFKYLEAVVDRHRGAIELLGERTKDASQKDNE